MRAAGQRRRGQRRGGAPRRESRTLSPRLRDGRGARRVYPSAGRDALLSVRSGEASFLVLSPHEEYGELLRLKAADVTVPFIRSSADYLAALDAVRELVRMRSLNVGFPRLFVVLDGLEDLPDAKRDGMLEPYRLCFDAVGAGQGGDRHGRRSVKEHFQRLSGRVRGDRQLPRHPERGGEGGRHLRQHRFLADSSRGDFLSRFALARGNDRFFQFFGLKSGPPLKNKNFLYKMPAFARETNGLSFCRPDGRRHFFGDKK